MLHAYLFFHCNLAFSSIEEDQRPEVIDRCYSPMLELAELHGFPIGVEATGWTLEQIARLRPRWVDRLRTACASGRVEFIGSGYTQLIGPLVPAAVNAANQRLGQNVYEKLLDVRPSLALINEQAYSAGILEHYADNGYSGIIMEWDNPRLAHPEWPAEYQYTPQTVQDMRGRPLKLLWNQSVVFQHLQRVVHDELDVDEYLRAVLRHDNDTESMLCLYGNDAEIFDFRPGRFETEAPIHHPEWERLAQVLRHLQASGQVIYCLPSAALALDLPGSGQLVRLESPAVPVPVKKQPKYNLLRWAVTGRDDISINSRCRALAEKLSQSNAPDEAWRELCALWASDYRTHITEKRWAKYLALLARFEDTWGLPHTPLAPQSRSPVARAATSPTQALQDAGRRGLTLETGVGTLRLNLRKGLAIERLVFPDISPDPLLGTLPHGFFDDVSLAADFFTGHVVMEIPGQRKRTDLAATAPQVTETDLDIRAEGDIPGFYCPMRKRVSLCKNKPEIEIGYLFNWKEMPSASLRLLHLTLFPDVFEQKNLYYATHNGGTKLESFALQDEFDHGRSVSFMVSAAQAFGMTEGYVELGDATKALQVSVHPWHAALVGMLTNVKVGLQTLTRLTLSCHEVDDTVKTVPYMGPMAIAVRVRAVRKRVQDAP